MGSLADDLDGRDLTSFTISSADTGEKDKKDLK